MSFDRFMELGDHADPAVRAAREFAVARRDADTLAASLARAEDEASPAFLAASERLSIAERALIDAVPTTLEGVLAKLLFHADWMAESCGCLNVRSGHPLARSVENLITGLEGIARSGGAGAAASPPTAPQEPVIAAQVPPAAGAEMAC